MLTDSGVNAMSDRQTAAMHVADDAYAGSETFNRLKAAHKEVFGTYNVLPAYRGRACENILAERFVKPGMKKTREAQCKYMTPKEIYHLLANKMDIIYFSARKLSFARGGAIISHNTELIKSMMEYIPLYEGFLTYGVPVIKPAGGLKWVEKPNVLRFFFGRLKQIGHWQEELVAKFKEDFGDSL